LIAAALAAVAATMVMALIAAAGAALIAAALAAVAAAVVMALITATSAALVAAALATVAATMVMALIAAAGAALIAAALATVAATMVMALVALTIAISSQGWQHRPLEILEQGSDPSTAASGQILRQCQIFRDREFSGLLSRNHAVEERGATSAILCVRRPSLDRQAKGSKRWSSAVEELVASNPHEELQIV
jgi:hypothetical protein